jgi:hypothetical protein
MKSERATLRGVILRILSICVLGIALAVCSACGSQPASNSTSSPAPGSAAPAATPAAPQVPQDLQDAAIAIFGNEAEILVHGDLVHNGRDQMLVINRLHKPGQGVVAGTLLTRLTVIENDDGKWKQILLCDEHLKNPEGFLGGAPIQDVSVWRLQYEQNPDKGLLLFFTPYSQKPADNPVTTEVAWNPKVKRYQAMDRTFTHFQGENPMLENPQRELK